MWINWNPPASFSGFSGSPTTKDDAPLSATEMAPGRRLGQRLSVQRDAVFALLKQVALVAFGRVHVIIKGGRVGFVRVMRKGGFQEGNCFIRVRDESLYTSKCGATFPCDHVDSC
jgi:hypothetical protein